MRAGQRTEGSCTEKKLNSKEWKVVKREAICIALKHVLCDATANIDSESIGKTKKKRKRSGIRLV